MTGPSHLVLTLGVFSAFSSQVLAGPCTERIAEIEKSVTMNFEGAAPTATGAVQGNASGATAGNQASAGPSDTGNRLPANRPATPDTAAAQAQSTAADQTATTPGEPNRIPANRPPSPEAQAAQVQASQSASPTGASQPNRATQTMALLSEAKNLDQAGREADCMGTLSRITTTSPLK
jgi:hypothetical protein